MSMETVSTLTGYGLNYNFVVRADSMPLVEQHPLDVMSGIPADTVWLQYDDVLAVADVQTLPTDTVDSVWVQLAHDAHTFGWIRQSDLLPMVSPDNPISRFIDWFSDNHLLVSFAIIALLLCVFFVFRKLGRAARMVHFSDISSFYPTLLCLLMAASAVFYSTIQTVNPASWQQFYFHPSLNPFTLPLHLSLFVLSLWAVLIVGVAAVYDAWRMLSASHLLFYLLGLLAVCLFNYVVFSLSTLIYVGYALFAAYVVFALYRYFRYSRAAYQCGRCGAPMRTLGKCPHCGALNK